MLVLSRKEGECIEIGDGITIMVVKIGGDRVRLGIEAPENVLIHRKELKDRLLTEGVTLTRRLIREVEKVDE